MHKLSTVVIYLHHVISFNVFYTCPVIALLRTTWRSSLKFINYISLGPPRRIVPFALCYIKHLLQGLFFGTSFSLTLGLQELRSSNISMQLLCRQNSLNLMIHSLLCWLLFKLDLIKVVNFKFNLYIILSTYRNIRSIGDMQ